ncbi:O-antigen ligase domain-containing protein [Deinococcus irradiatisoli]|uniref:O-antigen ligase domain-containing protein n=1 Tax=Deinococcus irradiatisoli TaxID=2202254 RepID=A0A2Z3JF08_9DEIO|nr:O-antigen ligase family protein [Deinococcus irradiatisoli]AWN23743.1 O-antigen ligase domain-containing protein [Deinococcus irradiatisoli]
MTAFQPPALRAWLRFWWAVLVPLYVLSPLSLLALPQLRRLPRPLWWVLAGYALSQQIPAFLAPEPLLASILALARTLLMGGLIGAGLVLTHTLWLRGLAWGLAVVYATTLIYSGLGGAELTQQRLFHPYMTSITLGLMGACGIWWALFAGGRWWWRLPFGVAALTVLLLSGSRGAMAAALLGCALGWVVRLRWQIAISLMLGLGLLGGGLYVGQRFDVQSVTRLLSTDTSGRDLVWWNAISVIQSAPLAGVGSYRLGTRFAPPGGQCVLWSAPDSVAPTCPDFISRLGYPWLIAHNVTLQQLAETGPLGLIGLFVLLGVAVVTAVWVRDPLGVAVLSGLLLATTTDNTLIVPGPAVGEVFWVMVGAVLARLPQDVPAARWPLLSWPAGLAAAGLMMALSLPLLASLKVLPPNPNYRLSVLIAPTHIQTTRNYTAYAQFDLPTGKYRTELRTCLKSCTYLVAVPYTVLTKSAAPVVTLTANLYPQPRQRLELLLYPGESTFRPVPLATKSWIVERQP